MSALVWNYLIILAIVGVITWICRLNRNYWRLTK